MSCFADGIKDVSDFLSGIFMDEETTAKAHGPHPDPQENPPLPPLRNPHDSLSTAGHDTKPCERKVLDAYFAQKSKIRVEVSGSPKTDSTLYTVKRGDTLSKIASRFTGVSYEEIAQKNHIAAPAYAIAVGQKLLIPKQIATEERTVYKKITKASLAEKVFLVVKTKGYKTGETLSVSLYEKTPMLVDTQTPLPFLKGNIQQTEVMAQVQFDLDNDGHIAVAQIALRPKRDKKEEDKAHAGSLEAWKEKFSKNKKDHLWLKVTSRTGEGEEKAFLKGDELEVSSCGECGSQYSKKIQCTRYSHIYGPVYWGSERLKNYSKWDELLKKGIVSGDEKNIIIDMSANEGKLDSVQSYDSEILTVGAMQKTVNIHGQGEFPLQVEKFKKRFPLKYDSILKNCGWTVSNHTIYYKHSDTAQKITGEKLKNTIRKGFSKSNFRKYIRSKPLEPIIKLAKDKDFQAIQIEDFIDRLNNKVLPIYPSGYSYKLENYVKSNLGRATLLDQHVNRPAYVKKDFSQALDYFFNKYPNVNSNPNTWGDNHSVYESKIIEYYGKNRRGTKMLDRYNKLVKAFK